MGYFAAQMREGHPLPPIPPTSPIPLTKSFYPYFNKAVDLAHRLGVKPTIEIVKRLEMAEQKMVQKPCDPHSTPCNPRKCAQNSLQPQGEPQGLKGKGKERAKDDDEVSLDYSGDKLMEGYHNDDEMEEIDPLDQPGDNNLETMEFDVDEEVSGPLYPIALNVIRPLIWPD